MIFVDTNVFMYAVGRAHPLKDEARTFFFDSLASEITLVTSAEVLQEMLHAYLPVGRTETLESAFVLVKGTTADVWPVEADDVRFARILAERYDGLGARDLLHLACCRRREIEAVRTFDRALEAAFRAG